ncbi:MAG: DUF368 domain-containing protein [Gammaproteobacteria bacterium]|nr:DUF368 domain-containing protein [Gammaproteobacteria bacterium]
MRHQPTGEREPTRRALSAGGGRRPWAGLFVRGLAMGAVEVVPGVSGGTIAFVTGIYRELVASLASFGPATIGWCLTDPKRFWRHHNLAFLSCLGAGMAVSLLVFAQLVSHWLASAPTLVWGFFFGLILYSAIDIGRARAPRQLLPLGITGGLCGASAGLIQPLGVEPGPLAHLIGGALAVGAWLLPAVSGSFVLLLLGLYASVLGALAEFDWPVLAVFALGCALGAALFSRLFRWLLARRFEAVMSFLTGLMAGGLLRLWPWRHEGALLTPAEWGRATGAGEGDAGLVLVLMGLGAGSLWLLTRMRSAAE